MKTFRVIDKVAVGDVVAHRKSGIEYVVYRIDPDVGELLCSTGRSSHWIKVENVRPVDVLSSAWIEKEYENEATV